LWIRATARTDRGIASTPTFARNDFNRDDARPLTRQSFTQAQTPAPSSLVLTKCPRNNHAHRSRADRRSGTRPPVQPTGTRRHSTTVVKDKETTPRLSPRLHPPVSPLANSTSFGRARIRHTHSYSRLSGYVGAGNGQCPTMEGYAGLGKAIGATLAVYRIAKIIQGLHCQRSASGSSLFSFAQRKLISRVWYATTRVVVTRSDP